MTTLMNLKHFLYGLGLACVCLTPELSSATLQAEEIRIEEAWIRLQTKFEASLAADQPGVLAVVVPEEGQLVEKGELLVELRAEILKAALAVAQEEASSDVNLRFAQAQLKVSQAELDKAEDANRRVIGTVPLVELDRLRFTRDRAMLQIEQAEHEQVLNNLRVKEAKARVEALQIRAPFTGVVTEVTKSVGEAVAQGDPILQLVNTKAVQVGGTVSLAESRRIKPGYEVLVRLQSNQSDEEAEWHKGELKFVDEKAGNIRGRVRVWAEVPNPDKDLLPGLMGTMKITIPEEK
ncbi:efflux RND transporter periplasmic adaptor subunit [Thalassoroseus pseudoceratinae]|uniref:efflux RND transporter periplasmic adaptor subunit n=1 Tax=Thalassoroseus pseudoceratinae TaxID=2713176 RepID=UPI0014226596|nr:efflux RND transporter periplasmic adaptor subunit [Thalassoroseus pseudoceratinae]